MKVLNYEEKDGELIIEIGNEKDNFKFRKNERFNNGELELFEYNKLKENDPESFIYCIQSLRFGVIVFLNRDYSRSIKLDADKKVVSDCITTEENVDYLLEMDEQGTERLSLKDHLYNSNEVFKNKVGETYTGNVNMSNEALRKFIDDGIRYCRILEESTIQKDMVLDEVNQENTEGKKNLFWPMAIMQKAYHKSHPYTAFSYRGFDTIEEAKEVINNWKKDSSYNVLCAYITDDNQNVLYLENNLDSLGNVEYKNDFKQKR